MTDPLTARLAATVHAARTSRGLSAASLAKLSAALGMTLSELIARAEGDERRLVRAAEQPVWVDPETGYRRRAVSPAAGRPLELGGGEPPPGGGGPLASG